MPLTLPLTLPRYLPENDAEALHLRLKQTPCPHCKTSGTLNWHGLLMGYSDTTSDRVVRGRRVYCSKRGRRPGCGRTVSLLRPEFLRGFQITCLRLWTFLAAFMTDTPIVTAFRNAGSALHPSAGWRLLQRVRLAQPALRTHLHSHTAVPEPPTTADPLVAALTHLRSAFPSDCPPAAYQSALQTAFL